MKVIMANVIHLSGLALVSLVIIVITFIYDNFVSVFRNSLLKTKMIYGKLSIDLKFYVEKLTFPPMMNFELYMHLWTVDGR